MAAAGCDVKLVHVSARTRHFAGGLVALSAMSSWFPAILHRWFQVLLARDAQAPAANPHKTSTLIVLACAALTSTAIKLHFALTTFGSTDVAYWSEFKDYIVQNGTVSIYQHYWHYNHPPMMSGLLWLLAPLVPYAPNGFPFLIRLPAILSDVVTGLLLYDLGSRAWGPRRGLWAALLFWASPVSIMVSGYHGNTDPVFMMLILLAARQALRGKPAWHVGALLGLACNVKLVPVVTVPLFFFWLPTRREKAWFATGMLALLLLGYGYHLTHCFAAMRKNVFDYPSDARSWGLPGFHFLLGLRSQGWALAALMRKPFLILLAIIGVGFGRRANQLPPERRPATLLLGLGWIFLVFLILTPGFGVQYLSWLNVVFPFLGLAGMLGYNLVAGTYLYNVYDFWNRGGHWNFADSDKVGLLAGYCLVWAYIVWLFLVLWATWNLGTWWGRRIRHPQFPTPPHISSQA
jgi:hypothetical protein